MSDEHNKTADAASSPAPKRARRTTTKNTKETTSSSQSPALSATKSAKKAKTSQTNEEKIPEKTAKLSKAPRAKRVVKPTGKTKSAEKTSPTEIISPSTKNSATNPESIEKTLAAEKDLPASSAVKNTRARKTPLRPRKAVAKTEDTAEKTAAKMQAADQDQTLATDEIAKKPKKEPKAKASPKPMAKTTKSVAAAKTSLSKKTASAAKNTTSLNTDTIADKDVAKQDDEKIKDTAPIAAIEDSDDAAKIGRRGRRGGRGRRGKKRPSSLMEQGADATSSEKNLESNEFLSAVEGTTPLSSSKKATSLAEGKPGRARAAITKKGSITALGRQKMFISVVQGEQVEVALVEEGAIHEYYLEMLHQAKTKGNIYKGVVHNIDNNLQAAFINYGAGKNGFLQIDEIHPEYYQQHHEATRGKKYPPIQKVIKQGQEVLVQVVKEPTGNKGAFLTTWLSLPGRFLVLTPGQEQIGISRKVDSDDERSRLRELMHGIEPGEGLGVIVRTVSAGTAKTTLKNDLAYLKRVWREIRKRGLNEGAPALLYKESNLAERAVRDYLTDEVCEVWVDCAEVAESLRETVTLLFPRKKDLIRTHVDVRQTLWERFNIQKQLEQIYSREVVLPSGGRLVFDQTEALMAIDINSGKISGKGNFESMALKTNLEAAEAIARHLKLRDIGGQVVIDFIEMRDRSHVKEVEKTMRNAMKNDRARHDVSRISSFGLLEIVRQRTGSSALAITIEPCPHCRGTGMRRNLEWQALQVLREMARQARHAQNGKLVYETTSELAFYLLNNKRQRLCDFETQSGVRVDIRIKA